MDKASNGTGQNDFLDRQRLELHSATLDRVRQHRLARADRYAEQPPAAGRAAA